MASTLRDNGMWRGRCHTPTCMVDLGFFGNLNFLVAVDLYRGYISQTLVIVSGFGHKIIL